jgi:polyisoprenoid-binding protein YceI
MEVFITKLNQIKFLKLMLTNLLSVFLFILLPLEFIHSKPLKKNTNPQWIVDIDKSYIKIEIPTILNSLNIQGEVKKFLLIRFNYKGYYQSLKNTEFWIPVKYITTFNSYRDEGIKSENFLDEVQYPNIKIKIRGIYPFSLQQNLYFVDLEISIKNKSQTYKDIIRIEQRWNKIIINGEIMIIRKDFDLIGNIILDTILSDNIKIKYYLEVKYQ